MKKLTFLLTILFLCVISIAQAKGKTYGNIYDVTFVKNYDGDTITFNIPTLHPIIGDGISIRVEGLDTPEMRGQCPKEKELAVEAKNVVTLLMLNAGRIDLINVKRGKYFRMVADVRVDNVSITQIILDKGLAVVYGGGTKTKDWCADD